MPVIHKIEFGHMQVDATVRKGLSRTQNHFLQKYSTI